MDNHHSWEGIEFENCDIDNILHQMRNEFVYSEECQNNTSIPIYNYSIDELENPIKQREIYKNFFFNSGAIIIKNAYNDKTMDDYNKWCIQNLEEAKKDKNCKHPKQKDKWLINDVLGRMSESNPDLLMSLINNKYFTKYIDILLGFGKIGSCTCHRINPGGDRQLSHVDYPMHLGSGKFWENNPEKLKKLTTRYQMNYMLPNYSIQVLIAPQKMNKSNGSTELVLGSHKIPNLDLLLHNKKNYKQFEKHFINAELEKGDFLIFNRRLCHRGGKNISNHQRNSLIIQCVWLWGIGQEIIESSKIFNRLENNSEKYKKLSDDDKENLRLRLEFPYPKNVRDSS